MATHHAMDAKKSPQLVGKTIQRNVAGLFKPRWSLHHDRKIVASMISERYLSRDLVGSYGSIPVRIDYDRKEDVAYFLDERTNGTIGVIDRMMRNTWTGGKARIASYFRCGGERYLIEYDMRRKGSLGYLFSDP